jgi:hypothetical protein
MRTISFRIDPLHTGVGEDWLAHLILALPESHNEGIWFDETDHRCGTVVNNRPTTPGWTVSFRDGSGEGDLRHYRDPRDAARAVIDRKHNDGSE